MFVETKISKEMLKLKLIKLFTAFNGSIVNSCEENKGVSSVNNRWIFVICLAIGIIINCLWICWTRWNNSRIAINKKFIFKEFFNWLTKR